MYNFFQKSESSKHRWKRFGYPGPYPVPVWKQFLDIRFRLQTDYPAGYPTGKPHGDHLWFANQMFRYFVKMILTRVIHLDSSRVIR